LGRTDFSMRDAWQASEGNNLAILLVFILNILLALGVIGVVFAIHALLSLFGALIATAAEIMLELAANWILMIFGITILTSLYGFFVQHRDF
jgi:protein-S-isoprenylcysteine O-methyltransferase Ste14